MFDFVECTRWFLVFVSIVLCLVRCDLIGSVCNGLVIVSDSVCAGLVIASDSVCASMISVVILSAAAANQGLQQ